MKVKEVIETVKRIPEQIKTAVSVMKMTLIAVFVSLLISLMTLAKVSA